MSYILKYHPKVKNSDIPKLDFNVKSIIKKAIESKLIDNPLNFAIPLRKTLKPYFKLRIGNYRIVFKIEEKTKTIYILAISHRKDIYKKTTIRLEK